MEAKKTIEWCDLGRFNAALKVISNSPLRGITMACLEIHDEKLFAGHLHANLGDVADIDDARQAAAKSAAWRDNLAALEFHPHPEVYRDGDDTKGRAFRLYSARATFTLAELQSIVPGVTRDDFRLMPVSHVLHQPQLLPELVADWKKFTEMVLADEAISVWAPKRDPFAMPYAQARTMKQVFEDHGKAGRSPLFAGDPVSSWFAHSLEKARFRENALTAYYAGLDFALADGLSADDVHEVSLPYALPLLVEKGGRIVALRDVRHAPEIMGLPPANVYSLSGDKDEGIAVKLLRESRALEAVFQEEVARWSEWHAATGPVDASMLNDSLRRVVEADAAFCARFSLAASGRVADLTDGERWSVSKEPKSIKPIVDWREEQFRALGQRAARFVRNGAADAVSEGIAALFARVAAQDAEHAKNAAKAALRRVAEAVQDLPDAAGDKVRHEDTGVKIGGARKDFKRHALSSDDLEVMNELERKSLVVKANVWPPLNYEAMREAGMAPEVAVAIKCLKDSILAAPDRSHRQSEEPDLDYIAAVGAVRDAMAEVATLDQFAQACLKLYRLGRGESRYIYGGSAMQVQLGSKTCHLLSDSEECIDFRGDIETRACVAGNIRSQIRTRVREGAEWAYLIKPKREKSDADKEADAERAEVDAELHRPHLDAVQRIGGEDWRGGRDIVAQDLIDHFGLRAVEFGTWLPQDERQAVLNMSFDSLCDLADALNLPPKAISFDGALAVAFGARGRGGKNAALAHFEPSRNVINLTRMKGAGTLAHEWWHGLDFNLASKEGDQAGYASKMERPRFDGDPMPKLVAAMRRRSSTMDELSAKSLENGEKGKQYAASWCWKQSPESRAVIQKSLDAFHERMRTELYDSALSHFVGLAPGEEVSKNGSRITADGILFSSTRYELVADFVDVMRSSCDNTRDFKKNVSNVENNLRWMLANISRWATIEAARDSGVVLSEFFLGGVNGLDTDFVKQAKALDETRSSPYWATDIEMFARAGAQFVHYELEAKGVRSDYLVFGADEERYLTHTVGNPNPAGEDRAALRTHFAALIEDYRLRFTRDVEVESGMEP